MAEPTPRIRGRLVDALLALAVKDHARAAGEHQPSCAVRQATLDHVPRAEDIGFVVVFPRVAHARNAADVKDDVHAAARGDYRLPVAQVGVDDFCAERTELRTASTAQCANAVALRYQLLGNVQPQKAIRAGDQCVHGTPFPNPTNFETFLLNRESAESLPARNGGRRSGHRSA